MLQHKTSRKTLAIIAALTTLPLIGIAYAGNQGMGGSGYKKGDCESGGMRHMSGERHGKQHVEGRIAFLKAELGINEEQMEQWQAVEDEMRTAMAEHSGKRSKQGRMHGAMAEMPAPDRIAAVIDMMESRLEHMKKMQTAVSDLYAVLTPEQQQSADDLLPRMGSKGRGMK